MEWAIAGAGVILGLLCGWFAARERLRSAAERATRDAESRAAVARGEADSLRIELDSRKQEIDGLHCALRQAEATRAAVEARGEQIQGALDQQRLMLQQAEAALADAFKSLAADALSNNNQQFLTLARENLAGVEARAVTDLENRQKAIEGVVGPVRQSLERMDQQIRAMEVTRGQAYGSLSMQLQSLMQSQGDLRSETANLVKALRAPVVRGRWGEIQLRRVVEMAGMLERCDFFEQQSYPGPDRARIRPDLRVLLPGGRNIVVDAKAPLQGYLESLEAPTEELRIARLKDHARQVREHMAKLAAKSYWDYLRPTPEFVLMFLPGETFFSAALEQDPSLIEQGVNQRVILATPTTLVALLRAVSYGWRQEQLADNAEHISELGQELYERLATMAGHFEGLGASLTNCVEKYNRAVGSLETRVLSSARRFKELGVSAKTEIAELEPIETTPRELALNLPANGSHANGK